METDRDTPAAIDAYIAPFPAEIRAILEKIRATVRKAAPNAEERISYRMPAFFRDGVLAYFAAFKRHIGLFPPVRDPALRKEASIYAGEKGNLRFPLDAPMPYALIGKIVKARLAENRASATAKTKSKASKGQPTARN